MFKLHIANKNYSSWSLRPWVLMRELGIPFEEVLTPFGGGFGSFSPSGRVPCLHDGEIVVWDSLAITEYVAEKFPGVWPADPIRRAWARCAAAEMHSGFTDLRARCTMTCGQRIRIDHYTPGLNRDLARIDDLWNEGLARFGGPFLAGDKFTAVDAFFAPVAFRVQTYDPPLSDTARDYVGRLLALPSLREWYASALAETWREPEHEAEARELGTWLHDYRAV